MARGGATIRIAILALAACGGGWHAARGLGVEVDAPAGAHVEEDRDHAFIGDGTFALNLFAVDGRSAPTADAQREILARTPGFVRITHEERGASTWRFDYALERGLAGTIARIDPGRAGRALDCGVHAVAPAVAAAVADACARVRSR